MLPTGFNVQIILIVKNGRCVSIYSVVADAPVFLETVKIAVY